MRTIIGLFLTFWVAGCAVDFSSYISRELDPDPPVVTPSIKEGTPLFRLDKVVLSFSEEIKGGDSLSDYVLSGDGLGGLLISSIEIEPTTRTLYFEGIPGDGTLNLTINRLTDLVDNPLKNRVLTWQADGLPKWRYLARKLSRGFMLSDQLHIQKLGDELIIAYQDEECREVYGYSDITVIAFNVLTNTAATLGKPCIVGGETGAPPIGSLLLANGHIYLSFTDTSTDEDKPSVVTLQNNKWVPVGSPRFTGEKTSKSQLSFIDNTLYLTTIDKSTGPNKNKLFLYQKDPADATDWQLAHSEAISTGNTYDAQAVIKYKDSLFAAMRNGTVKASFVRSLDLTSNTFSSLLQVDTCTSNCDSSIMLGSQTPMFYNSYVDVDRKIRFKKWDELGWSQENWVEAYPEFVTTNSSATNFLSCQLRGDQPFCAYVEGGGKILIKTYTPDDSWHDVKSDSDVTVGFNGGGPGFLVVSDALYIAFRDKDTGYGDTLSLISYQ